MGRIRLSRYSISGRGVRVVLLLALVGMLVGCGRGTFVGRQYQDFTAYYNTFYNATQAFEEGVESVTQEEPEIDRNRYLSIFQEPQGGSNAQSFETAIEKSADVLREHPNSKWVDDAVLLIGKSYFYQQNYVGAAQKFREGIALETEREDEARFWLARTLVVTERYAEAADVLASALEGADDVGPWQARMYLVRGELFVRQERWEEAERALQRGQWGGLPDHLAARAAFLLGQVRETLDRPEVARAAYRQAAEYTSSVELEFAAQVKAIELEGLHGDTEEALEQLRALERDDKFYEKRGEIALIRARLYRAQGRPEEAKQVLTRTLHRDEAPSGETRGRLYYDLATLHREVYEDFSTSAAYYDTAATAMGRRSTGEQGRETEVQPVPWAPSDAGTQADRFAGLAQQSDRVARMDSLLRLGRMSEDEFQLVLKEMRQRRQAERERPDADQGQGQTTRSRFGSQGSRQGRPSPRSDVAAQTGGSEAGFLFHKDPARVQEGQRQFQQVWGDRPRVDNWRRRAAIRESNPSVAPNRGEPSQGAEQSEDRMTPGAEDVGMDISDVPRDSASQAQMEADRAVSRYKLANSLFRAAGRPDSAATWYRRIIEENGDHPVAKQALYALAEAHRAQGDTATARQTYRRVIDQYPESSVAERARERLGKATPTTLDEEEGEPADSAYARAYNLWQEGRLRPALEELLSVAEAYSASDIAPKALLAAGVVYRRLAQEDSSAAHRRMASFFGEDVQGQQKMSLGLDTTLAAPSSGEQTAQLSDSSAGAPSDSSSLAAAQRDTSSTDSVEEASADAGTDGPASDPLMALLNHLTETYPEAPQSERAQQLLQRMRKQRVAADTSTASPTDSTAVAERGGEEGGGIDQPSGVPDTVRSASGSNDRAEHTKEDVEEDRDPLPAPTSPSSSEEVGIPRTPLDPSAEGWTLLVQTYKDREEAMRHLRSIEQELDERWPVDILTDSKQSPPRFRLVVGHFETKKAANQGRDRLSDRLSGDPELWSLSSPDEES